MHSVKLVTFLYIFLLAVLSACGGSNDTESTISSNSANQSSSSQSAEYTIETTVTGSGTLSPTHATAFNGEPLTFEVHPEEGYRLKDITGCSGRHEEGTYFIEAIIEHCTITATFEPIAIAVNINTSGNGQYHASQDALVYGDNLILNISPGEGHFLESARGCDGETEDNKYIIDTLTNDCSVELVFSELPPLPDDPKIWFEYQQAKTIRFHWDPINGADELQLLERLSADNDYEIVARPEVGTQTYDHRVFLLTHTNASYKLRACNIAGCSESNSASTSGNILEVAGNWQRNNEEFNSFGTTINESGNVLLTNSYSPYTAHIYTEENNQWLYAQQLTGSARTNINRDSFGQDIAVSDDGKVIAIGAPCHVNSTSTAAGNQNTDDRALCTGAVYIFRYKNGAWEEEAYLYPAEENDQINFGSQVAISTDGNTLAFLSQAEQTLADGSSTVGAIHLYQYENGVWNETDTLAPSCEIEFKSTYSGELRIVDKGNIIALSAPVSFHSLLDPQPEDYIDRLLEDPCYRGFVYIFRKKGDSYIEERIMPEEGSIEIGNLFTIANDGNAFVLSGTSYRGKLYLYEKSHELWEPTLTGC